MKKLLDDGVDLPLWQREKKSMPSGMSRRSCRFQLLTASFHLCMGQCRCLTRAFLRQHVVPWVHRMHPVGKYIFHWIYHQPTLPGPPSNSWQNSGLQWIGCHLRRTRITGLLYLKCLAGRSPGDAHKIWQPNVCPSPWNEISQQRITSARPAAAAMKPSLQKIQFTLNRWLANSPAHTNKYFKTNISVSLCHRGGRMENINAWYLNTHMVYL